MAEEQTFQDLIRRVRAGEEEAAAELLRRYEPAIRRTVRARLRQVHLRRLLDSVDICQSVMASFFVRVALGRYELDRPEDLLRLLATMAHNKLANAARHHQADRRDHRREIAWPIAEADAVTSEATASQQFRAQELLEEARRRLTPDERRVLELRLQGQGWREIATVIGGRTDTVRKRFDRAIEQIAQEMGLDETPHE